MPDMPRERDQATHAVIASATWEGSSATQETRSRAPGVALCVRAERYAVLLRTKQLVVDQRAGLSNKDQRAARDRECDQFHGVTPVMSRTDWGDMGTSRVNFNLWVGNSVSW